MCNNGNGADVPVTCLMGNREQLATLSGGNSPSPHPAEKTPCPHLATHHLVFTTPASDPSPSFHWRPHAPSAQMSTSLQWAQTPMQLHAPFPLAAPFGRIDDAKVSFGSGSEHIFLDSSPFHAKVSTLQKISRVDQALIRPAGLIDTPYILSIIWLDENISL